MNIVVCVKRVPATGGRILLTDDGSAIDTRHLGFTVSPHEECAVEEAVRIVEREGGSSTVLTLGPTEAEEQLRDAMAIGIERAVLLETDGRDWDPVATARAITAAIEEQEGANGRFDLILFGNESADSGGFQVGIRVAYALGRPCVTGVKAIDHGAGRITARRESAGGGWESFDVPLPAVVTVKEGLNLPRYPSVPGRLRARKKDVQRSTPAWTAGGLEKIVLRLPQTETTQAAILGQGADAAPAVVDLLDRLGVLPR